MVAENEPTVNSRPKRLGLWKIRALSDNHYSMYRARCIALGALMAAGLAASILLGAQESGTPSSPSSAPAQASIGAESGTEAVFAPFPSRLRVSVEGTGITLTWLDSPDLGGPYAVYRSAAAIGADQIDTATRVATVAHGVQSYTDRPPDSKPYYYLVLALAGDGSPYRIAIPLRNATTVALSVSAAGPGTPPEPSPAAEPAGSAGEAAPQVDGLTARAQGDAIVLSYHAAAPGMRLVVYRGAAPIEESSDLLDAALISAFADKDGTFADYPVPGIDYWYAILSEDDLKAGRVDLRLGHNATAAAVRIAARSSNGSITALPPGSRTTPLPSLLMDRAPAEDAAPLPKGSSPPPEHPLSPETEKAVASLLADAPLLLPKMPPLALLAEERAAPAGGEDYALSLIVNGKLVAGDWSGGVDELKKYLSLNRSAAVAERARFYLGEALTHTGAYRDAVFEFLSAQSAYSVETKPWIDYVLYRLREG